MMEEKQLAENIKLNLGNNIVGHFDVWIDEKGRLELIPLVNGGDTVGYSYVLAANSTNISDGYRMLYKQFDFEEDEN